MPIGQLVRLGMFLLLIIGTFIGLRDRKPKSTNKTTTAYEPLHLDDPVAALKDSNWRMRAQAVRQLGEMQLNEHISRLADMLADSDSDVRSEVATALAKYGQIVVPDVIEKLQQGLVDCREAAVNCLAQIDAKSAVPALAITLNHDESAWVREAAARALGTIGGKDAVIALIAQLTDADSDVRKAVRAALIHIGTPDAIKALNDNE